MSILEKIALILALMALGVLAFPISTALAQRKEEPLVFVRDPELAKPIILAGPVRLTGPYFEEKKIVKQTKTVATTHAKRTTVDAKGFDPCNCWSYVYYKRHGQMPLGYGVAGNYPVFSHTPSVGAIIITYEGDVGHMGMVTAVDENYVTIEDYNYIHCGHAVRTLPIHSRIIKGYIP